MLLIDYSRSSRSTKDRIEQRWVKSLFSIFVILCLIRYMMEGIIKLTFIIRQWSLCWDVCKSWPKVEIIDVYVQLIVSVKSKLDTLYFGTDRKCWDTKAFLATLKRFFSIVATDIIVFNNEMWNKRNKLLVSCHWRLVIHK